jgi:hypothetical protein
MSNFLLTRTGDRPLSFEGEPLATASSEGIPGSSPRSVAQADEVRWHVIRLYRLAHSDSIVCAVEYHTTWPTEVGHDAAEVCSTVESVASWLRMYDPLAYFIGPPPGGPGSSQEQRQMRLRKDLKLRYENLISDVLACLEPERVE